MRYCMLALLLVAIWSVLPVQSQTTLDAEIAAKEAQLRILSNDVASLYQTRCASLGSPACSQPACGSGFKSSDGFDCIAGYGSDCGTSCPGMMRSLTKSTVWIPEATDFVNVDAQAFVASTVGADSSFGNARTATSGALKAWQLIGDSTGVTRIYPGNPQSRNDKVCSDYDARTRPWYVSAASGPKDLILLLDSSGSMEDPVGTHTQMTREELLRPAVDAILNTLTQNDFVAIVPFSGASLSLTASPLRATEANLKLLKQMWADHAPGGSTAMGLGFEEAFRMLSSPGDGTSGCTPIILFLTDGKPSDGDAWRSAVAAGQQKLTSNNRSKAHIFAVGMGNDVDTSVLKAVACENEGMYESILDGVDPLIALRGYYQFLAAGLTDSTVRWSNPYTDALGLGQMVTAGIPIYDRSQGVPILVGVAAADVTISELEKYADFSAVIGELQVRSKACPSANFTTCVLQQLRESSNTKHVCTGSAYPTVASCRANAEAVTRTACTRSGTNTLNSYLCEPLNAQTLLPSPYISTTSAQCCQAIQGAEQYGPQCSGCRWHGLTFPTSIPFVLIISVVVVESLLRA